MEESARRRGRRGGQHMAYSVKELFYTLQGEGAQSGRPAVFCRFAGCNLWSGREEDRSTATCRFCDTDFVGTNTPTGGRFATAAELAAAVAAAWPQQAGGRPFVICTGGEPLLQMDEALIAALHDVGFEIAVETNGTQAAIDGIDWICVSPKADAEWILRAGDELKLVYPQSGIDPAALESMDFKYFFLQPMDGAEKARNTQLAIAYCLAHPHWRLSLQTHKVIGIP